MEWLSVCFLILVTSLGFFVNTVTGFGAAVVGMPLLVLVFPVQDAVVYFALLFFLFSVYMVVVHWHDVDFMTWVQVAPVSLVGLYVGVSVLTKVSSEMLRVGLAVFILVYVVYRYISSESIEVLNSFGPVFGVVSGFFSGVFSTGGPPVVVYVENKLEDVDTIRSTLICTFAVLNVAKIPLLVRADLLGYGHVVNTMYTLPFFVGALYLGQRFYSHLSVDWFEQFVLALLLLSGITLLI